MVQISLIYTSF